MFGVTTSPYEFTQTFAINDAGQAVGSYRDEAGEHAFLRQANGQIKTLHIPYSSFGLQDPHFESAVATGINNKGQIVGTFQAVQSNGNAFNGSFLLQPDVTFVGINPSNNTYVRAISNNGYVLGTYTLNGYMAPFVMNSSLQIIRTIVDVPGADGYGPATLSSINSNGDIIGSFDSSYGAFITNVFSDEYSSLPSPKYCTAGSINDAGVITGTCTNSYQAFILTPTAAPEPSSTGLTLAAFMLVGILRNSLKPRLRKE